MKVSKFGRLVRHTENVNRITVLSLPLCYSMLDEEEGLGCSFSEKLLNK